MEPSVYEQLLMFSNKHLPGYLRWIVKWPFVLKILGKMLCLDEIFSLKDKLNDKYNFELIHELVKYTGLTFSVKNFNKVPAKGRLLIVANHPLAGADWLLMVECLGAIRKDIKVVINKDVNTLIINLRDLFIPVDTYASFNDLARKQIGESLEREEAVIIYPAGGISFLTWKGVMDKSWKNGVARFSREFSADVLPVYIRGRFRKIFYLYPLRLRRFLIVRNMLHPFQKKVDLVIGDRLPYEELIKEPDLAVVSSRLREITYRLAYE